MNYILAIDQGTSSTRAMIYTVDGELITSSQYPITSNYPHPGWVEQDPEEIWQKTLKAMQDVVSQVNSQDILTCGITNQRETTLVWNKKTGECLAPAIVWQDRRTEAYCQLLSDRAQVIEDKTGLRLDPYFSATKLNWLLENNAQAKCLAAQGDLAFGTVDSFLIWRLSNGLSHCTDTSNASRTMLFNIKTKVWDKELLDLFAIPFSVLPQVLDSDAQFAVIDKKWLGFDLPITGVAGDQQAALIGQGCFQDGMVKATFGTGGFIVLNTGDNLVKSKHKLLTSIAYTIKERTVYCLEGSIYHAGTAIKWLRDEMQLISNSAQTESLAKSLESNEGVYLVSSFSGLGAPHWLSSTGAAMFGLTQSTNKAHFARAALEAVCYQTRDILTCMREDSHSPLSLMRVDGGMAANAWFLQFLADQCQLTIEKPRDIETTARGAAVLAAIGYGLFDSLAALQAVWQLDKAYQPQRALQVVESDYQGWMKALTKVIG